MDQDCLTDCLTNCTLEDDSLLQPDENIRANASDSNIDNVVNLPEEIVDEQGDDSREPRGDRQFGFKFNPVQVQSTISADRTHDSAYQSTGQIFQAIKPGRKGEAVKNQNDLSGHNNVKQPELVVPEGSGDGTASAHKLQDYQMQLMLLEQQNKKRLLMARKEQEEQYAKDRKMATQNSVPKKPYDSDSHSTIPDASPVKFPALNACFQLISTALESPEECAAQLVALRENLEGLQTSILEYRATGTLPLPEPRCQMVYRVKTPEGRMRMYLDQPQWVEGEDAKSEALVGNLPVRDIQSYLERNPEICFIVYRDFSTPKSSEKGVNHTVSIPKYDSEMIEITSKDLEATVPKFISHYGFSTDATGSRGREEASAYHATDAGSLNELLAPYPAFYHASRQAMEPFLESLDRSQEKQFQILLDYVMSHYGNEYDNAEKIISHGRITRQYIKYLFKPGDVVVQKGAGEAKGFLCSSWVTEEKVAHDKREPLGKKVPKIQYSIKSRYWTFDGVFSCKSTVLRWEVDASNDSEFGTDSLSVCPLAHVNNNLKDKLRRRGERIWKCRRKCLVSYHEDPTRESHYPDDERYMMDMMVYRELHKREGNRDSTRWVPPEYPGTDDLGPEAMERDDPPSTEFLYLQPVMTKGFNLRKKKWMDLKVDNIGDVVWNETAFERLVLEEKSKKLIQALVTEQIETKRSTDLISGKGNGLIMLLHGGPGTGKTLTAESVAEIAQKPLYSVTCGDIGTQPEAVESYLESVLHLGKIWGCVVLLDEADVFLEQRSLQDLHRNALVSVFLRVLEYYEGILILTSNRVGTFDEAFKSRIQLAIHYNDLSFKERSKIWENFISRLEDLEEEDIDFVNLRNNVENLANFEMNGREIRNAITNARQYTRWERKQQRNSANCKLDYEKIKIMIDTSTKFDEYIKRVNGGYKLIAVDEGLRAEED
ncbi:hypothetical protein K445DRAFT_322048 [Daldinia sp. EC12]|nr:hypothetical protein K445DRAFT_322048 [Daldinia sp. EC12]